MSQISLAKDKIKILLLEGVHPKAVERLRQHGYTNIEYEKGSLPEDELRQRMRDVHFLGIRSRTQVTAELLAQSNKLVAIGCFCIGTNQVDLAACQSRGIPVFNAPYSNTRSVAELVLGEILLLLRRVPEKNALAHRGIWQKSASGAQEARGKILGIVGYGHIGSQLGILAETIGMQVIYYDILSKLALGNATPVASLTDLLQQSDVVSLHIPETPQTHNLIGQAELSSMKPGAILINAARGTIVDIPALSEHLDSGQIGGAAIDVFPLEPKTNDDPFDSPLRQFDNVLLTPHIGGSTLEAQENIGLEVASKLVRYSDNGSSVSAVNFPEVSLPEHSGCSRLLHIHHNRPGVLNQINQAFADQEINITGQYLQTNSDIGYVVMDVATDHGDIALAELKAIDGTIRSRILY